MVRDILIWPDAVLKQKSQPVTDFGAPLKQLILDMFETMYEAPGVGLAAVQVGVLQRVIVLDTRIRQPESSPYAMVNPRILSLEGKMTYKEGCLSIPGESEDVDRAAKVTVEFQDADGTLQTLTAEGLLSVAIQHECDHLDGIVYVDKISVLKREFIKKRMKKLKQQVIPRSDSQAL